MDISTSKNPYYGNGISTKVCGNAAFTTKLYLSPVINLLLAILSICSPQTKGEIPSWYNFHFQSFFPVKYTNLNFAFLNLSLYISWYILLIVMHAIHKWHMKYSQVKSKNINWKSEVIVLFGSFQIKSIAKK